MFGCFGFNGPLREYSTQYQAASEREGERSDIFIQTPHPHLLQVLSRLVGLPGTESHPAPSPERTHPVLKMSSDANAPKDTTSLQTHKVEITLTPMRRDDVASTSVRRHFDVMCPLGKYCQLAKSTVIISLDTV